VRADGSATALDLRSVSTWRHDGPVHTTPERGAVLQHVAGMVAARSSARLRVAVDGRTGAGKTVFADELAAALRSLGRTTMRTSMDDFKHPWRHAREHGYDRLSGEGYYRNAYDFDAARTLLLEPAGPHGSGRVVLCAFDPLTGEDHRGVTVDAPDDAVLVVDTVFAFRPEYDEYWDERIWLEVDLDVALARGIARDTPREGAADAASVHRGRYAVAEDLYLAEVAAPTVASVVVDNTVLDRPVITRPAR
jgi:uridine kinase